MSEDQHHEHIRQVIDVAKRAERRGNRPFGALLVSADGEVLATGENSQLTEDQLLAHAEMVLLYDAVRQYDAELLQGATMYTSAEPCAMCSGAIFWSGIRRLVFGVSGETLHEIMDLTPDMLVTSCRAVLAGAGRKVEVVGPVLEEEAVRLFKSSKE